MRHDAQPGLPTPAAEARHSGPAWTTGREASRDTTRIEAFSDAVIAIMLTLLAIELLQLDVTKLRQLGLGPALAQNWSAYAAFGLTFLVVGQIWMTHHNLWRYITNVDQGLSIINLLLLMVISTIPLSAKVLADSFADLPPADQTRAAVLYSATMLCQALAFNALLWWSRWQDLLDDKVADKLFRAIALRFLAGPALYTTALLLALIVPWAGLACYLGVIVLYLIPGAGDLPTGKEAAAQQS